MITIGEKIPDIAFLGIDADGNEKNYKLSDFEGQNLVLYFYPKDNTPGCTQEACDFRDNINRIVSKAAIVGVSADTIQSHKKFKEKHELTFILASDEKRELLRVFKSFGEKKMYGKILEGIIRSTFLIDKNGILRKEWRNVKVRGHVDEVINTIKELEQGA